MGKRKSSARAPPPKRKPKLSLTYCCPFCNTPDSVTAELDRANNVGTVRCSVCGEKFSTSIHSLSEAVDVYSEWLDECEANNT